MESTPVETEDATLKMVENEVATVLIHLKKFLRIRNKLCSLLLRLPTEAIVHILSYIMGAPEQPHVWQPIFSTCHQINNIMRTATELWWKVDCTRSRVARIVFLRSRGNPRVLIANLQPCQDVRRNEKARRALEIWRDMQVFHGHRLHTLELCGNPSDVPRFSWIFEQPLPRLHRLKIRFFGPLADDEDESQLPIPSPIALQLPMDLPLQTLDLNNATLPWSSNLFAGLRELRMNFRDCETVVEISADELLGVFDASPQLESLSLVQVRPRIPVGGGESQYAPTRIAQLPNLASLELDNPPESIGHILVHMNIPAIDSLEIRSHVLPFEIPRPLRFLLTHHLPGRLFLNPPVFGIWAIDEAGLLDWTDVTIGGFKMRFDADTDVVETVRDAIVACIFPMVPQSVTVLKLNYLDLGEQEWREFLRSHPEVRSIEYSNHYGESTSRSLWNTLCPARTDAVPLCPKLESISLSDQRGFAPPLLNCLLNRKNAGFGLRHLEFGRLEDRLVEEFRLLVEELQVAKAPVDRFDLELVGPAPMNELGFRVLITIPSGNTVAV